MRSIKRNVRYVNRVIGAASTVFLLAMFLASSIDDGGYDNDSPNVTARH